MGIGINAIGNYGFYAHKVKPTHKTAEVAKTQNASASSKIKESKNLSLVNNAEKEFFADLYPEHKQTVMDYHFYQRSGEMSGVAVGSIINRRG